MSMHYAHLYSANEQSVPGPGYGLPRLEKNKEDGGHLSKGAFLLVLDVIRIMDGRHFVHAFSRLALLSSFSMD